MTRRPETAAPAAAAPVVAPTCCSRPMSTISVTEAGSELRLLSCAACSRHAWLMDGQLLDREGMLEAVKQRIAEAPRPKGGRPKGSGKKQRAAAAAQAARSAEQSAADRAREMRGMLSGFRVLGQQEG